MTNPIVWKFCLGVLIARIYSFKVKSKYIPQIFLLSGIFSYVILIYRGSSVNFEPNVKNYDNLNRFLIWGLPSSFIVFGALFIEKNSSKYFDNKIVLMVANASFSIYLIHTLFISLVNKFFNVFKSVTFDLVVLISVVKSLIIGVIYYFVIEKRLSFFF